MMTEQENKENKPAEKPKEEKKEKPVPAKVQPQAVSESAEGSDRRRKKINSMSLKDIDVKIKHVKETMGNLQSRYAKELCKQRDILSME